MPASLSLFKAARYHKPRNSIRFRLDTMTLEEITRATAKPLQLSSMPQNLHLSFHYLGIERVLPPLPLIWKHLGALKPLYPLCESIDFTDAHPVFVAVFVQLCGQLPGCKSVHVNFVSHWESAESDVDDQSSGSDSDEMDVDEMASDFESYGLEACHALFRAMPNLEDIAVELVPGMLWENATEGALAPIHLPFLKEMIIQDDNHGDDYDDQAPFWEPIIAPSLLQLTIACPYSLPAKRMIERSGCQKTLRSLDIYYCVMDGVDDVSGLLASTPALTTLCLGPDLLLEEPGAKEAIIARTFAAVPDIKALKEIEIWGVYEDLGIDEFLRHAERLVVRSGMRLQKSDGRVWELERKKGLCDGHTLHPIDP